MLLLLPSALTAPPAYWRSVAEAVPGISPQLALQLTRELQGLGPR
jgi:hypothetical protein